MKIARNLLWFVFVLPFVGFTQDIHFSEMEFSPLTLNPAMAGVNYDFEANLNYRNQWGSVAKPYQTIAVSADGRLNPKHKRDKKAYVAAGLDFFNDQAGTSHLVTNHINLSVATHILLGSNSTLGVGVYGGWSQRSIDLSRSTWGSQYDGKHYNAALPSGESLSRTSFGAFDVGAGIVYSLHKEPSRMTANDSKFLNIGFSVYHLNRPNYSFLNPEGERLYMRYSAFINTSFGIKNTDVLVEPALYFYQQGPAREILIGSYVKYILKDESSYTIFVQEMTASLGLFYRNRDALIVKALFQWNGIGLGFSYDINTFSSLVSASKGKGAFEFALRYLIPDFSRRKYITGGRSFF